MLSKIKARLEKNRKKVIGIMTAAIVMAYATGASAAVDTEIVADITSGFDGVKATALAVIGAIAGVALLLFAGPYAWQYAKRIFKTVAR